MSQTTEGSSLRYKILLVDDEQDFRRMLRSFLREAGHTVLDAASGREALLAAVDSQPDIVISDVQMPDMDGLELCRRLRAEAKTAGIPVLLMSGASKEERDQLEGFARGADDYVLKPFEPPILLAKTLAVLRRYATAVEVCEVLRADGVRLDVQARTVSHGGKRVDLTRKEFDLLTLLLRKRGHVLSAQFLLESVWGYDLAEYNDPHTVTVHLSSLRRKLGSKLSRRIVTVPGSGYRFEI
ncbi:MAG: response regulator transcription factor [Elusimicrobia bacterium]|nr:response regulator transcription factor [Elusimicrobiota bacterium]